MGLLTGNIGALAIRIGFWGPLYFNYNKDPPQKKIVEVINGNYQSRYSTAPTSCISRASAVQAPALLGRSLGKQKALRSMASESISQTPGLRVGRTSECGRSRQVQG